MSIDQQNLNNNAGAFEVGEDFDNEADMPKKLGLKHYLNVGMFVISLTVVILAQFVGFGGEGDDERTLNKALSDRQTILSAKHESWDNMFLIWLFIFASEGVFVVSQLAWYWDHKIVNRISFWWVLQCGLQTAYIVLLMGNFFSFVWPTALVLMLNFTVLLIIIGTIEATGKKSFMEYWCLRFPFSIHAGYLLCESIAWCNILLQETSGNGEGVVTATSMTGVTAVLTITAVWAVAVPRPDGWFCLGVAWTYWFVASELVCIPGQEDKCRSNLRERLTPEEVSDATLEAFGYAAVIICYLALCLGVLSFGLRVAACMQRGRI